MVRVAPPSPASLAPREGDNVRDAALQAATYFLGHGQTLIQPYGSGNVNATFLVTPTTGQGEPFILQRLNPRVFPQPELIIHNLRQLTAHLQTRQVSLPPPAGRRWQLPQLLPTTQGEDCWQDYEGAVWRALTYIPASYTLDAVQEESQAWEVGYALGRFHLLVEDLPPASLADTLPGFHVTPLYLAAYDAIAARITPPPLPEVIYAQEFIQQRRAEVGLLEEARQQGKLTLRVTHGDPKVNNVLLDAVTGQAVGLVDLDTVKPGLLQTDLGDCLRSVANTLGEETLAWDQVHFDLRLARALWDGYLSQARPLLTPADYAYGYISLRLIAFELGLRFFTDFLAGDVYFRCQHPLQNLWRAMVQFNLTASIEAQEEEIRRLFGVSL